MLDTFLPFTTLTVNVQKMHNIRSISIILILLSIVSPSVVASSSASPSKASRVAEGNTVPGVKYDYIKLRCPMAHIEMDIDFIPKGNALDAKCYFGCAQPHLVEIKWVSYDGYRRDQPWALKASRVGPTDHHVHASFIPQSDGYLQCRVYEDEHSEPGIDQRLVSLYFNPGYVPMNLTNMDFNQSGVAIVWNYRLPEDDVYEDIEIQFRCLISPYYCKDAEILTTRSYKEIFDNETYVKRTNINCTAKCSGEETLYFNKYIYWKNRSLIPSELLIGTDVEHKWIHQYNSGENISLTCNFSGPFIPEVTWIKDYDVIDDRYVQSMDNRMSIRKSANSSKLILRNVTGSDSGSYCCNVSNIVASDSIYFNIMVLDGVIKNSSNSSIPELNFFFISLILASVLGILIVVAVCQRAWMPKHIEHLQSVLSGDFDNPTLFSEHAELQTIFRSKYDAKWEIDMKSISFGGIIGYGNFGQVMKGLFKNKLVAIKTPRDLFNIGQYASLIGELKILSYLGPHPNIVNLIGASTERLAKGDMCLIVELCEAGNLKSFLIKSRSTFNNGCESTDIILDATETTASFCTIDLSLTVSDLMKFCYQICRGMEFLSSKGVSKVWRLKHSLTNFVHRLSIEI